MSNICVNLNIPIVKQRVDKEKRRVYVSFVESAVCDVKWKGEKCEQRQTSLIYMISFVILANVIVSVMEQHDF